jgi:hypothetical protein
MQTILRPIDGTHSFKYKGFKLKTTLHNKDGVKLPHSVMIQLRQDGMLNLGIVNDVATKIAAHSNLGPTGGGGRCPSVCK